jgi:hypothetical protein
MWVIHKNAGIKPNTYSIPQANKNLQELVDTSSINRLRKYFNTCDPLDRKRNRMGKDCNIFGELCGYFLPVNGGYSQQKPRISTTVKKEKGQETLDAADPLLSTEL